MNYSTLKEAYSIDSFEKKNKKKRVKIEEFENDVEYPVTERIDTINKQEEVIETNKRQVPQKEVTQEMNDKFNENTKIEVEPYYDEDIEKYLNIDDFKETNSFVANRKKTSDSNQKKDTECTEEKENIKPEPIVDEPKPKQTPKDIFYANLINIGLFMLVGFLIIFICDQITEIAISLGMRKTIHILEPYLQDIK
jgi:hypothetical protein